MNFLKIFQQFDLENVDVEEYTRKSTRREALAEGSRIGMKVAIASLPFALSALPKLVKAQSTTVVDALNFALTLEYLEAEFYAMGMRASGLVPSSDTAMINQISKHETAHVAFLKTALGSSAVAKPEFDFTAGGTLNDVFTNYATFLAVAQAFEDTGVRAYKGQAGNLISDKDTLTAALQIHSVEARHASEVRRLRDQYGWIQGGTAQANGEAEGLNAVYAGEDNITQGGVDVSTITNVDRNKIMEAFDETLDKNTVLSIVDPFIKK